MLKIIIGLFALTLSAHAYHNPALANLADSKTIIGLELIEADKTLKAMESAFGHVMIRIVTANNNVYDPVLNFVADVGEEKTNYLKGITGGYSNKLEVTTLYDTWWQYTVGEGRVLNRYPIKLNEEQMSALNETLADYDEVISKDSYKFFTQNCAHSTIDFLRSIGLEIERGTAFPRKVDKRLRKTGILGEGTPLGTVDIQDLKKFIRKYKKPEEEISEAELIEDAMKLNNFEKLYLFSRMQVPNKLRKKITNEIIEKELRMIDFIKFKKGVIQ